MAPRPRTRACAKMLVRWHLKLFAVCSSCLVAAYPGALLMSVTFRCCLDFPALDCL